jgi:hypothetical protein
MATGPRASTARDPDAARDSLAADKDQDRRLRAPCPWIFSARPRPESEGFVMK